MRMIVGRCQLCGEYAPLTDDHLPPKYLYPKVMRHTLVDMHTVKACDRCNNGSKEHDELFKVFVGLVADSPWQNELHESVQATLKNNNRLLRLIEDNGRIEEQNLPDGTPMSVRVVKIPPESRDQIQAVVDRMIKGLFFRKYSEVLVDQHQLGMFIPEALHPTKLAEMQSASQSAIWESINNGTVRFLFITLENGDIVVVVNLFETVEFDYVIQKKQVQ